LAGFTYGEVYPRNASSIENRPESNLFSRIYQADYQTKTRRNHRLFQGRKKTMANKQDYPYLLTLLAILTGVIGLAAWFIFMAWASTIDPDRAQVRAITTAQHNRCAAMPRGSQEMEDRRHDCFVQLYESPWAFTD
jgi:hypothetical protein